MKLRKAFETYAVIRIEDFSNVDFSKIPESPNSIRKNLLEPPTQFIIKWDVEPSFISDGTVIPDGLYTHEEGIELMQTEVWAEPDPELDEK